MNEPSSLNFDASGSSYSPRLSDSLLSRGFSSLSRDPWLRLRSGRPLLANTHTHTHTPYRAARPMKKALRETQTLRAGCSKAEPKIFAPPQTPFPGARDDQSLISWRWSLPSAGTDPVWWGSKHAISSYRGNRPTNKQTQPQTHRHDRLQYTTTPQLARNVTTQHQDQDHKFETTTKPSSETTRWDIITGADP